jgi:hypothetical protein
MIALLGRKHPFGISRTLDLISIEQTYARSLCRAFHETFNASRCVDGACPVLFHGRF